MGAWGYLFEERGKRAEHEPFDILPEMQGAVGDGERNNRTVTNSRLFETIGL